jgi:hypothetical protein
VNSCDSTRKIRLPDNNDYQLNFEIAHQDSLTINRNVILDGSIALLYHKSLDFNYTMETINIEFINGSHSTIDNDYSTFEYDGNINQKNIDLSKITAISFSNPGKRFCSVFGQATLTASLLTALIVAPLSSINYQTGAFNKDRYYILAASGLIGVAVSIPLIIGGASRHFNITTKDGPPSKYSWYLNAAPKISSKKKANPSTSNRVKAIY